MDCFFISTEEKLLRFKLCRLSLEITIDLTGVNREKKVSLFELSLIVINKTAIKRK